MKTKAHNPMKLITIIGAVSTTITLSSCNKATSTESNGSAPPNSRATAAEDAGNKATEAVLTKGETGYVRIKEYSAKPLQDATPGGDEGDFQFGDAVNLKQKKDGLPIFWLVDKGQSQVWLPAYVLTANKAEIEFLKAKERIPDTMSFSYNDGHWRVWGNEIEWAGGLVLTIDSQGMVLLDYPEGASPFAIKGNAVMFDVSVAKAHWNKPPVFGEAKKALQLSPTCLYYCVSDGENTAFECIDLVALKVSK